MPCATAAELASALLASIAAFPKAVVEEQIGSNLTAHRRAYVSMADRV
jgi:hypothetical protein